VTIVEDLDRLAAQSRNAQGWLAMMRKFQVEFDQLDALVSEFTVQVGDRVMIQGLANPANLNELDGRVQEADE